MSGADADQRRAGQKAQQQQQDALHGTRLRRSVAYVEHLGRASRTVAHHRLASRAPATAAAPLFHDAASCEESERSVRSDDDLDQLKVEVDGQPSASAVVEMEIHQLHVEDAPELLATTTLSTDSPEAETLA